MTTSDELYNQILTNGPSSETLFHVLSKLKEEGQLKRVIQECIKALNVYPNDTHIRQLLAETYFSTGLIHQAETELEKVTTQIDDLVIAYKLQAKILNRQKRGEEGIEALKLYLVHRPDDQEAIDFLKSLEPVEETPVDEAPAHVERIPSPVDGALEEVTEFAEEEGLSEIATPTLAEVYFSQGQVQEAVITYEKVVAQNPEDERSRKRLDELKSSMAPEPSSEDKEVDKVREKKKKMITILEAWRTNIQKMSKNSLTV